MRALANVYAEWLKQRERRAFLEHAAFYVLLNSAFILINLSTFPQRLWFQYPLLFWGFGLLIHLVSVLFLADYGAVGEKFAASVGGRPSREEFVRFHREKARRGVIVHVVVYAVANAIFVVLNLSLTPHKMWFIYPLLGWGVGLLFHLIYGYMLHDWDGLWATFAIKAEAKGG